MDAFIVDAKYFVPQSRPRLFIVAVRNDLRPRGHFGPDQITEVSALRPKRLIDFIVSHPAVPWSLRRLPFPTQIPSRLEDVLEDIPVSDKRWWSSARCMALFAQMSERHQEKIRNSIKGSGFCYGTVFRRMRNGRSMAEIRMDGIAGCLRTPKGGSARQILFRASREGHSARLLTPLECARLMGAEDIKFPESASVNTALFALGDAVCVPVVRWIADNYLTPLATELTHGCILRLPVG